MRTYCTKFRLLPTQTPQVVTTTKHPDDPDVGGKIIANLSGDAQNSASVLTDLTDELLRTGLNCNLPWTQTNGDAGSPLLRPQ